MDFIGMKLVSKELKVRDGKVYETVTYEKDITDELQSRRDIIVSQKEAEINHDKEAALAAADVELAKIDAAAQAVSVTLK